MSTINFAFEPIVGMGKSCASFGELLQGVLPNKKKFMVTFPIELFSEATFTPNMELESIEVFPKHKHKSYKLVSNIKEKFSIKYGGILQISSQIPEGKGLASSTADLVASARAMSAALHLKLTNEEIAELISNIEPSDGLMYPEIVSFFHEEVKLIERIAHLPKLCVIGIDEGSIIDTVAYNSIQREYSPELYLDYSQKLKEITLAIKQNDLKKVGQISTESALLNQKNNFKPSLEEVIEISHSVSALGVIIAHSGTYIGVLLNTQDSLFHEKKNMILELLLKLNKEPKLFYSACENTLQRDMELVD